MFRSISDRCCIRTAAHDGLFTIYLCRPPVNVLNATMMTQIHSAVEIAEADDTVRAVMITGAGERVFSAGVEVADHSRERMQESMDVFHRLLAKLQAFSLPTAAALNGAAMGGGLELALACDMILSTADAKIGHPEIKLASIAVPGILMLQGRMPPNRLVELLAGGEPISGQDACAMGLVNRLVPKEGFEQECGNFMARFTRMSRPVLRLLKRVLVESRGKTLESGIVPMSRIYVEELLKLEDAAEGIEAFAQKRAPRWKHR